MLNDCETWYTVCFSMATALIAPINVEEVKYTPIFYVFLWHVCCRKIYTIFILKYHLNTMKVGKTQENVLKSYKSYFPVYHTCVFFSNAFTIVMRLEYRQNILKLAKQKIQHYHKYTYVRFHCQCAM